MRVVRHGSGRTIATEDAKLLTLMPIFPGESVKSVEGSCYAACLTDVDVSNPPELNWWGITVPWQIIFATTMLAGSHAMANLDTVAAWDALYEMYLLDTSQNGDEKWGGDVDTDPEGVSTEEGHDDEELIDSGLIGIKRFFRRETLLQPYAAAGNDTIRFGDGFYFNTPVKGPGSMGGVLMFGCVRHDIQVETNFNLELDDVTAIEAIGLLMAGDYTKIRAMIKGNAAALGDYIRTTLFGGDAFIEASTYTDPSLKAYSKVVAFIETPLQRQER